MNPPFQPGERVEVRQNEGTVIDGRDASNLLFYATVVRCVDATHQINGIEVKDDDGETFYVDWRELRRVEK